MVSWLIRRAQRTPYFHLPGYMERWWLVPYREALEYTVFTDRPCALPGNFKTTAGTGPVSWRRPIAWLLQRLDVAVRVHHILRSDAGRDPHDHPWPFVTIVLRGGYWEHRFDAFGSFTGRKWHGPGSVLFRRARDLHLLELPTGKTAWTLFITGRKQQTWGFKPEGAPKIPHWQYERNA